jgi:uncharacterized protein YceK
MKKNILLLLPVLLLLTGCTQVVTAPISIAGSAVGATIDVAGSAVGAAVDIATSDDDEEEK